MNTQDTASGIALNHKITVGAALAILSFSGFQDYRQGSAAENFEKVFNKSLTDLDKRLTVFEVNSTHANESLMSIRDSLTTALTDMKAEQNGGKEKLGSIELRLMRLEEWRATQEGKVGK